MDNMWRFPNNSYTFESGLDTSDMETFKKDPISSLAREICQNSIDAASGVKPVKVEFSLFEVERDKIPGISELENEIIECYEYKKMSLKEGKALQSLKESIQKDNIKCLRISDSNTTGVEGANENKSGTPFYNLTKGSGVSDKNGSSGGSKGIGKFASFVVSTTNTVFYSTKAIDGTSAYIGISKLRSRPFPEDESGLLTMGIGYYGSNNMNYPVMNELTLDTSYKRNEEQFGTDVYIIGFNDHKGWQGDIIAKVLESFMVAIMKDELEVIVDGCRVGSDTVKNLIYDDEFEKERTKTEIKEIHAQFELLSLGEGVTSKILNIGGHSEVTVYVKQYDSQQESNSTKQCVMVRYPYMKIKRIKTGAFVPFSALCVIEDNELNKKLRAIENPQHTDWEIKRLDEYPEEKRETKTLKKDFENAVKDYINETLRKSSSERTDIEGAGEFLPSQAQGEVSSQTETKDEQIVIRPIKPVKTQNPKTEKSGEDGESYEFSTGDVSQTGEDGKKLKKKQGKDNNPNPNPKPEPKEGEGMGEGDEVVLRKKSLSGMRFIPIVTDKKMGKYDYVFISNYDENDCDFGIQLCGEANDKYPMEIVDATVIGQDCTIEQGKVVGISLEKGKKYKISCTVKSDSMFASEVIMNAYR